MELNRERSDWCILCEKISDAHIVVLKKAYKRLVEENERLREKADRRLENLKAVLEERNEDNVVAETVKNMQEKLIAEAELFSNGVLAVPVARIGEIARNMIKGAENEV
jgi:ElaB/YqjD/DUF883 family membrane-anchored ribosome-binding protein